MTSERRYEIGGIVLLTVTILLFLALVTDDYHGEMNRPLDGIKSASNALGAPGAAVASALTIFLGGAAHLLYLLLCVWGFMLVRRLPLDRFPTRLGGAFLTVLSAAVLLQLNITEISQTGLGNPTAMGSASQAAESGATVSKAGMTTELSGGILGMYLTEALEPNLSTAGTNILAGGLLLVGVLLSTEFLLFQCLSVAGTVLGLLFHARPGKRRAEISDEGAPWETPFGMEPEAGLYGSGPGSLTPPTPFDLPPPEVPANPFDTPSQSAASLSPLMAAVNTDCPFDGPSGTPNIESGGPDRSRVLWQRLRSQASTLGEPRPQAMESMEPVSSPFASLEPDPQLSRTEPNASSFPFRSLDANAAERLARRGARIGLDDSPFVDPDPASSRPTSPFSPPPVKPSPPPVERTVAPREPTSPFDDELRDPVREARESRPLREPRITEPSMASAASAFPARKKRLDSPSLDSMFGMEDPLENSPFEAPRAQSIRKDTTAAANTGATLLGTKGHAAGYGVESTPPSSPFATEPARNARFGMDYSSPHIRHGSDWDDDPITARDTPAESHESIPEPAQAKPATVAAPLAPTFAGVESRAFNVAVQQENWVSASSLHEHERALEGPGESRSVMVESVVRRERPSVVSGEQRVRAEVEGDGASIASTVRPRMVEPRWRPVRVDATITAAHWRDDALAYAIPVEALRHTPGETAPPVRELDHHDDVPEEEERTAHTPFGARTADALPAPSIISTQNRLPQARGHEPLVTRPIALGPPPARGAALMDARDSAAYVTGFEDPNYTHDDENAAFGDESDILQDSYMDLDSEAPAALEDPCDQSGETVFRHDDVDEDGGEMEDGEEMGFPESLTPVDSMLPGAPPAASRPSRTAASASSQSEAKWRLRRRGAVEELPADHVYPARFSTPSMDLFDPPQHLFSEDLTERMEAMSRTLEHTLGTFNIEAWVTDYTRGPTITRFELEPAPGIKVSRFVSLSDDIALALKAKSVRVEAPIPGKGRVGIEVPNFRRDPVLFRELMESREFSGHEGRLRLVLGKDIAGNVAVADLASMPHLLVAGATGAGKTVAVKTMLASLLCSLRPDELQLILIDPKMVELSIFDDIPHLITPVVTEAKKASAALRWLITEMEERYRLFSHLRVRNIDVYNESVENGEIEMTGDTVDGAGRSSLDIIRRLPYIVCIIDELADLMMLARAEVEDAIARLAQLARAVGIHLIIATQRPSVDVLTGVIKANFPTRLSFQVSSKVDSRCILDQIGAERLIGKGDMLFLPAGQSKPNRLQGAFVSDDEMNGLISYLKTQAPPQYRDEIERFGKDKEAVTEDIEQDDDLFDDAVRVVLETGQASISMVQRRLRVGYTRAARLIDMMELKGIVGPHMGSKAREILVPLPSDEEER